MPDRADADPPRTVTPEPCGAIGPRLAGLALGTLSGSERRATLEHIDRCRRCRADADGLARIANLLLELAPGVEPPPGFDERVLVRLARQRRPRSVP